MAETISTAMFQPFSLAGDYVATVYDQAAPGGASANLIASAQAGTYRAGLAPAGGTGTEASPYSLLPKIIVNLNAILWRMAFAADGRVVTTYLGTGTGRIVWGAGTGRIIANLLGYTSDVGPLATGATQTAEYQPTHAAFLYGRTNSSGWTSVPGPQAYAEMDDGDVFGEELGVHRMRTSFDAMGLPTDAAARTTLASSCTQMFPGEARWTSPTATPAIALTPGWSLYEFIRTAGGKQLGVALGTWPQLVAGTTSAYHAAKLTRDCLAANAPQRLTESGNRLRTDWPGLSLWYRGKESQ